MAHPMWWPERQSSALPTLPLQGAAALRGALWPGCTAAWPCSTSSPQLPHLFTRLFHIPAIRDITLEHLQLLSNQLLAPPTPR